MDETTETTDTETTEPGTEVLGERLDLAIPAGLTCDRATRTVSGLVLPYGVIGERTSQGPIVFSAGSLQHHPDLRRVKLLIDHDQTRAVGYATQVDQTPDGVLATFHVPEGAEGDEALAKASNGVRDGFSVGVDVRMKHQAADGSHNVITQAALNEVSLVSLPAFSDSRVAVVLASQHRPESQPQKESTMPDEATETTTETAVVQVTEPKTVLASAVPVQPITAAAPYADQAPGARGLDPLTAAARTIAATIQAGGSAAEVRAALGRINPSLTAALADVIPADDAGHGFIGRPDFLGELWTARRTGRPIMESFGPIGTVKRLKETGWKWVTKPAVGPYAGDKAEIPSNEVETAPVEVTAERLAGGWDVDRIYVDLGEADMIEALFRAAIEDYAVKSEAWALTKVNAAATAVVGKPTLAETLVALGVAAGNIGATLGTVAFAPDVWAAFLNTKRADLPWWIDASAPVSIDGGSVKIGGLSLSSNPALAAGAIVGGDRRAVTFKEAKVRVNALDLPRGGVDLGVFAYVSALVNDARAVFKSSIVAA